MCNGVCDYIFKKKLFRSFFLSENFGMCFRCHDKTPAPCPTFSLLHFNQNTFRFTLSGKKMIGMVR